MMTQQKANELLRKWVRILTLQDWTIRVIPNALPEDMIEGGAGEVQGKESIKTAVIRILDEACYGDRIVPFRFEKTLIHELLHLKFCLLGESGNPLQDRLVHQLIDDMARILYTFHGVAAR